MQTCDWPTLLQGICHCGKTGKNEVCAAPRLPRLMALLLANTPLAFAASTRPRRSYDAKLASATAIAGCPTAAMPTPRTAALGNLDAPTWETLAACLWHHASRSALWVSSDKIHCGARSREPAVAVVSGLPRGRSPQRWISEALLAATRRGSTDSGRATQGCRVSSGRSTTALHHGTRSGRGACRTGRCARRVHTGMYTGMLPRGDGRVRGGGGLGPAVTAMLHLDSTGGLQVPLRKLLRRLQVPAVAALQEAGRFVRAGARNADGKATSIGRPCPAPRSAVD